MVSLAQCARAQPEFVSRGYWPPQSMRRSAGLCVKPIRAGRRCDDANQGRDCAENDFTKRRGSREKCRSVLRTAAFAARTQRRRLVVRNRVRTSAAAERRAARLTFRVVGSGYCLSYTATSSCATPLTSVAFVDSVMTLPCAEIVRVVDPTTFPSFFSTLLTVLPLTRFSDNEL